MSGQTQHWPVKTSNLPDKCPMSGTNLQACAKLDARRQLKPKILHAAQLVQANYYNLFDWTIQTREVI